MLTATLTRPGTITAADITLTSREPTLALCRALLAAGHADQPMTVVDGATGRPTMHVASIAKAALLTVDEGNGCRFRRWRPFAGVRGAPGMASDDAGVGCGRVGDRRDPGGRLVSRRQERQTMPICRCASGRASVRAATIRPYLTRRMVTWVATPVEPGEV